jgi:hypothetical protein
MENARGRGVEGPLPAGRRTPSRQASTESLNDSCAICLDEVDGDYFHQVRLPFQRYADSLQRNRGVVKMGERLLWPQRPTLERL